MATICYARNTGITKKNSFIFYTHYCTKRPLFNYQNIHGSYLLRSEGSGASTPPLEMKMDKQESEEPLVNGIADDIEKDAEKDKTPPVDIMAQQLKFVACLKILMEELSTLATGFEVDGTN